MAPLKERVDDYPLDAAAHAIRRLPRAEVAALLGRDSNDVHLDGGDIHLQLVTLDHVPVLEGALAGQNRRQREADVAQRAAFSDDDWDDDD